MIFMSLFFLISELDLHRGLDYLSTIHYKAYLHSLLLYAPNCILILSRGCGSSVGRARDYW